MRISARPIAALVVLAASGLSAPLFADATVTAIGVKFEPLVAYIEPGESVSWTAMNAHNVETLGAMIPEGGIEFNSELGADVSYKFDTPGIYVYKCTPHWGVRMGGIVVVGKPEDPNAILERYLAAIEENRGELLPAKGLIKKAGKDMEDKGLM